MLDVSYIKPRKYNEFDKGRSKELKALFKDHITRNRRHPNSYSASERFGAPDVQNKKMNYFCSGNNDALYVLGQDLAVARSDHTLNDAKHQEISNFALNIPIKHYHAHIKEEVKKAKNLEKFKL